jgi:arylamine N-acetyltransferase
MDRHVEKYLLALGFEEVAVNQALTSVGKPSFEFVERILFRHSQQLPFCTMNHVLHYHFTKQKNERHTLPECSNDNGSNGSSLTDELRSQHTAPLHLDTESLVDRLVVRRKGGYCFEQNTLVHNVLEHLGYNVRQILARVVNLPLQKDPDVSPPRPGNFHCVTVLEFQHEDSELPSTYMVDAAFGDKGPTQPIPLPRSYDTSESTSATATSIMMDPKIEERAGVGQSRRIYKIVHDPNDPDPYALLTGYCDEGDVASERDAQSWFITYKFNWLLQYAPIDAQVSHYYSYTNANGAFTQRLYVCRHVIEEPKDTNSKSGDIHTLFNLDYRVRDIHQEASKEERKIQSATEMFELLNDVFEIKASAEECQCLYMIFAGK